MAACVQQSATGPAPAPPPPSPPPPSPMPPPAEPTSSPAPPPAASSAPAPSAPAAAPCAPGAWRTVDEGPFSFSVPCELEKKPVKGIDSRVGRYESGTMVLTFDHGFYSSSLSELDKSPGLTSEQASIGGKTARIITYKSADAAAPRPFGAAVHFPDLGSGPGAMKTKLTMLVEGKSAQDQGIAKRIFKSIEFD